MDLRKQLSIINRYRRLEREGQAPELECDLDEGLLLHYVDHGNDTVFFECLSCGHRIYPGAAALERMEEVVELNEGNHLG